MNRNGNAAGILEKNTSQKTAMAPYRSAWITRGSLGAEARTWRAMRR